MTQLHAEIASDHYWDHPPVPDTERVPLGTSLSDGWSSRGVIRSIDRIFQDALERGADVKTIQPGEELALDVPGALLKIVKDMRVHPKKAVPWHRPDTPELFDKTAQAMVDELLYSGSQTDTIVETATGVIGICRRVVYARNSTSGSQLIGKASDFLGREPALVTTHFMQREPVGHVSSCKARGDRVEARIASAQVIMPKGARRAKKIFDLGALGLAPAIMPSSA